MSNNNFKLRIGKYAALLALITVCGLASVNNLRPFGYASYYSAVFSGASAILLFPALIASALISGEGLGGVLAATFSCLVASLTFYVLKKNGKRASLAIMALVLFIGQALGVVIGWLEGVKAIFLAIDLCLCYVFSYVTYCALKPILQHKMKYSLMDTEIACLYITVIAACMGICCSFSYGNVVVLLLAAFFLPTTCRLAGKGSCVILAIAMGLGCAFKTLDVSVVAMLGFIALSCGMFISSPRILSAVAQVFAVAVFELFFEVDYYSLGYHALAVALGGAAYALIPSKALSSLEQRFFRSHSSTAVRHVINKNRYELSKSVATVSAVFDEMSWILHGMERQSTGNAEVIAQKTLCSVCSGCSKLNECRQLGLDQQMTELAICAEKKGKASISDIPPLLVDKCLYIGKIMAEMSNICAEVARDDAKKAEGDRLTSLLSTQMLGVSKILKAMSADVSRPISYDVACEKRIIEELKYYNVICSEALVCIGERPTATLIVRRDCTGEDSLICSVVGKLLRAEFSVKSVDDGLIAGWSIMELCSRMQYDVVFGVASKPLRCEATGDTHSFMKIGSDKFLMAICDGMGSGSRAFELSSKAMTLVEDFYRAGFDHQITTEGINGFLSYDNLEGFSALDVVVCDLSSGAADIVKLATPSSYVKRVDSVIRVDSSSLPIGVVSEATPAVSTFQLEDGDVIVLTSDGVAQRFTGDKLSALINNSSGVNPQRLADVILEQAQKAVGAPEDDMTVAVCRVFKRA